MVESGWSWAPVDIMTVLAPKPGFQNIREAFITPSNKGRAGNLSMSVEGHLSGATYGESTDKTDFEYFKM